MKAAPLFAGALVCLLGSPSAWAQETPDVKVKSQPVRGGVHMLTGQGGNMALLVGEDGAFLVDDQFAPLTADILAKVGELNDGKAEVRFLVNTHWHGDHTGGNKNLGEAGAVIVAHANVRQRMSSDQFIEALKMKFPPSPKAALPVITFADEVRFHFNDEEVVVRHFGAGHTDGDAIVHFTKANAIHTGDVFFNGFYPFIDVSSGGSLAGIIATAKQVLAMADAETKIVPGHGPLAARADLERYIAMLETVQGRLKELIDAGKTLEEVVAAKPTAEFDAAWGGGFLSPERWLPIAYEAAKASR